jgi:spore maturation protein CgeB
VTIVMFYHSLLSDWNHGNAHFLRGVVTELLARGHEVRVYEPKHAWSRQNLIAEHGERAVEGFRSAYPGLGSRLYELDALDLDEALAGADLVIVHEWSDPELVRRIGEHRAGMGRSRLAKDEHEHEHEHPNTEHRTPNTEHPTLNAPSLRSIPYTLLFHDTHHRAVTDPESMAAYDLTHYEGVLAFGRVIRDLYLKRGWASRAWVWHEAADTRVFHPVPGHEGEGDLVWIGNWGDDERTAELREFLLEPVKRLGLKARVYGVRYPETALAALADAGIEYAGWLPNYRVPEVFARFKVTVHVPRRPYVEALPGIPTIRVFEALACGIPLVSAPWEDAEGLFTPGHDYLVARSGDEMVRHLRTLLDDEERRQELALYGRRAILARHTCRHRVDELLALYAGLQAADRRRPLQQEVRA